MYTMFIIIGLFLGGPEPKIKIYDDHYAHPQPCNMRAAALNKAAKQRQEPYFFYCKAIPHVEA